MTHADRARVVAGVAPRVVAAVASRVLGVAVICAGCTPSGDDSARVAPAAPAATPATATPGTATPGPATAGAELDTDGWQSYTDAARGVSFRYPPDLETSYIRPLDWPPIPQVLMGPLQCTEAGSEIARAGRTERKTIGGRSYCVTRETEGAAGSIYTSLAYAFEKSGRVVILTFTLRAVQCGNYDDPRKRECETEREAFDTDAVVDGVARTLELGP